MKNLLICFLVVQITAVFCSYRRQSSRNSVSFLLRKVCVEVTGLKAENLELKEKVAALEDVVAGLTVEVEKVAALEEAVAGLTVEVAGSKQAVDGNWASWMQWSGCSNNCGPGTRTRQRQCLDPRPSNGGSDCPGSALVTEACETNGCEDPYSAFAIQGNTPTYHSPGVLIWSETTLNIAPNNAAHYNTSTGKYCPDHRGTYLFQLNLYKYGPRSGNPYCAIVKESQSGSTTNLAWVFTDGNTIGGSTSTIVDLEQGDCVYVDHCIDTSRISPHTTFSGTLLNLLH